MLAVSDVNFYSGLKNVWFFIFVACFESDGVFESEYFYSDLSVQFVKVTEF